MICVEKPTKYPAILLLLACLVACARGGVFSSGDAEDKDGGNSRPQPAVNNNVNDDLAIAIATYEMTVTANNGTQFCKGIVVFTFSTDHTTNPKGELDCMPPMGKMDLGKVFKERQGAYIKEDMKQYPGFDKFTRIPNPVNPSDGTTYHPPRPDQLGPIIRDPEVYRNFMHEEETTASFINDKGEEKSDTGKWTMRVLEINSSVVPTGYKGPEKFDKVIKWEMTMEGMNNIRKGEVNAFDSATYYYNIKPIRVPKIVIKSRIKDMMPGFLAKIGDFLFSGVTIELNLREWKQGA